MSPRNFHETFVAPTVAEYFIAPDSVRRAVFAIWALDALVAHIFVWAKKYAPGKITDDGDATYRETIATKCDAYRTLRDASKAVKHAELNRGDPVVRSSESVQTVLDGFQAGAFQASAFHTAEAIVQMPNGPAHKVADIIAESLKMLETEMIELGVPYAAGIATIALPAR